MSTEHPDRSSANEWRDCRPSTTTGCDPSSSIDERKCRDAGLAAQLDYTKEPSTALQTAQDDYEKARKEYRDKRHDAAVQVQSLRQDVKHLIERIKCLIEQDRVVRCIDKAFGQICEQLDCCDGPLGCAVGDVTFDTDPPDQLHKVKRRIARYKAEVSKARDAFNKLVKEPGELSKRVDAIKAAVTAIQAALNDDAAKLDLKKQLAAALVAERNLGRIWNGYADGAAYVDCLCRALTTWSDGVDAVAVLVGAEAVLECRRKAAEDWCKKLTNDPVAEILVAYDRLCASEKPCGPAEPDDPDPEPEVPDECGCGCGKRGGSSPAEAR